MTEPVTQKCNVFDNNGTESCGKELYLSKEVTPSGR